MCTNQGKIRKNLENENSPVQRVLLLVHKIISDVTALPVQYPVFFAKAFYPASKGAPRYGVLKIL